MKTAFRPRTEAQQDHIIETRLRAIETGEWMEKLGLHQQLGIAPPIGANFFRGESTQDIRNRAARAGLYLPGKSNPTIDEMIRLRKLEREHGVAAMAMPVKDRFGISTALDGFSAWEIPDLVEYDYSMANIAAASTIPGLTLGVVPGTNAPLIGSPDPLDAATTGADTTSRKSGTGSKKYFNILSVWVYTRTSGGAVYTAAAGTTMQPFVISAAPGSSAQLSTALSAAALAINGITNFWNQIVLVAPADRVIQKFAGTGAQAGIVAGFWGDFIASVLVVTGALNIQGNSISMTWELA
jgi:hypothetical protein